MNEDAQQARVSPESEWFYPPPALAEQAPHPQPRSHLRQSRRRSPRLLGKVRRYTAVVPPLGSCPRRQRCPLLPLVHRRADEHHPQRARPPHPQRAPQQNRLHLGGRTGRPTDLFLLAPQAAKSNRFANVLRGLGLKKGDRVTIYMGRIPEIVIAMLACAKIGAPHSVVYGGFSEKALADRIQDAQSRVLITQDGAWLRGKIIRLKDTVDAALQQSPVRGDRRRRATHRAGDRHASWPRLLVARANGFPSSAARRRNGSHGRRRPSLHPLYQRHDRQAQRRPPYPRRLSGLYLPPRCAGSST